MLTLRCARCGAKLFKYKKIGKGRVLRCYKDRIGRICGAERDGSEIKCGCGGIIGEDEGSHIKMKQNAFTFTGTYSV